MASNRSAAWIFPVVILAVPGVMFYGWWSHLNSEQRRQMTMKIRRRTPEVFTQAPDANNRLTNPIAAAASTNAVPLPVPIAPPAPALAAAAPAPVPAPALTQAPPPLPPAPGEPAVMFTRDPTLSPYDLARIEQKRLETELREAEIRDRAKNMRVKRSVSIESSIELQGIVSTADAGNKAIVNGDMVGEGEFIGQAKVVRITSQGVVFLHKGRKFTKTISKE